MHGRNVSVRARSHHREAALTAYRRQQQRHSSGALETILLLDSPPRFRAAYRLGRMRLKKATRHHNAATLRDRLFPHTRIRPHGRFQARVVYRALLPFNRESPGQTFNSQLAFRTADDHVNARARERIFARLNLRRRGFASHRTRGPIGLRVHRRIRLQLAHNFHNLIPCNDREPSAHDEPLLERIAPNHRLYPELFFELLRKPERHGLTLVDLHRNALVLKRTQMLPSSLRPHL